MDSRLRMAGILAGFAALGYGMYQLLHKKQPPLKAVEKTVEKATEIPSEIAAEVKETVAATKKSASEKQLAVRKRFAEMAKKRAAERKGKKFPRKNITPQQPASDTNDMIQQLRTDHKGHETTRGLSQDQQRVSKEPHEQAYRKSRLKHL